MGFIFHLGLVCLHWFFALALVAIPFILISDLFKSGLGSFKENLGAAIVIFLIFFFTPSDFSNNKPVTAATKPFETSPSIYQSVSEPATINYYQTKSISQSKPRHVAIRDSKTGSCSCPYDIDKAGRTCGGKSAYSRPNGDRAKPTASNSSDS